MPACIDNIALMNMQELSTIHKSIRSTFVYDNNLTIIYQALNSEFERILNKRHNAHDYSLIELKYDIRALNSNIRYPGDKVQGYFLTHVNQNGKFIQSYCYISLFIKTINFKGLKTFKLFI